MSAQGEKQSPSYNFLDFYNDCKSHHNKVLIETDAMTDAMNLLHLFEKDQILEFLVQHKPEAYRFVNSRKYEKGTENDRSYHPLLDSYSLDLKYYDLYISFCIQKSEVGWIIKSIHSDNSHKGTGDTISIGSYIRSIKGLI